MRLVHLERLEDERGFFARTYCGDEFAAHGLHGRFEQQSLSRNLVRHTLRGMHYSLAPQEETKLVRCVRGAVFDVAIDLRPGSPTCGHHFAAVLSADNADALYIPAGFAHGFQTLEPDSDVLYMISPAYRRGFAAGVRWDDPGFAIEWPGRQPVMSTRDSAYPDWRR